MCSVEDKGGDVEHEARIVSATARRSGRTATIHAQTLRAVAFIPCFVLSVQYDKCAQTA
jgi:hypothetical protein